jgi:hypothetical protein
MPLHSSRTLRAYLLTSLPSRRCARPVQIACAALFLISLVAIPFSTQAATCVGNYSSITCGSNEFCCFNDPNSCGNGSQPCCSGGKSCSASNVPNWSCNGQYACVAMSAAPAGAGADAYPIGLCANTCMPVPLPTPTPATSVNCASQAVSWSVSGNTCSATVGAVTNGQTTTATAVVSAKVSGATNPSTPRGTQQFVCNNGVLSASGSGTCATTCASSANVGAECATAQMSWCNQTIFSCRWDSFWGAWCEGITTDLAGPEPQSECLGEIPFEGGLAAKIAHYGLIGPPQCTWAQNSNTIIPKSPDTCALENGGTLIWKRVAQYDPTSCAYRYVTAAGYPKGKPASCPSCKADVTVSICNWVP